MSLAKYKQKRSFRDTPEPRGGTPSYQALQFVVQKHDATRLHYDFRLEMQGVLKSWAVPKGPSLNPADKRLAMQVEDHPFDYKDFEGIIPEGNYGAGTVIVWDAGTYEPLHPTDGTKKTQNRQLMKELKAGSIKIIMYGKKLKGEFALVRTTGRGEHSWLLIKHRDKYATEAPVTEKDKSVQSRKTLEQVAANPRARFFHMSKSIKTHHMAKYSKSAQNKVEKAMHEKKSGTLKSGRSGKKVTSRKQAIAIGLSEARKEGARVPPKKSVAKKKS